MRCAVSPSKPVRFSRALQPVILDKAAQYVFVLTIISAMGTMGGVGRCSVLAPYRRPRTCDGETGGNAAVRQAVAASFAVLFQGDAHGAGAVKEACRTRPAPTVSRGESAVISNGSGYPSLIGRPGGAEPPRRAPICRPIEGRGDADRAYHPGRGGRAAHSAPSHSCTSLDFHGT